MAGKSSKSAVEEFLAKNADTLEGKKKLAWQMNQANRYKGLERIVPEIFKDPSNVVAQGKQASKMFKAASEIDRKKAMQGDDTFEGLEPTFAMRLNKRMSR